MTRSDLTAMTVADLKALAKKKNVTLSSRSTKPAIIDAIIAAEMAAARPAAKRNSAASAKASGKSAGNGKSGSGKAAVAPKAAEKNPLPATKGVQTQTPAQRKPASSERPSSVKTPVHEWKLPPGVEEPLMAQERISESKYYTGSALQALVGTYGELSQGYGEDKITLMTRDPFVAYAYWETSPARIEHEKVWFGWDAKLCVRIYDITGVQFDGRNAVGYFDQEVFERAGNWYFDIGRPSHSFCADIGLLSPSGRFLTLARSNYVTMPQDTISEQIDEDWMLQDEEFWQIYGYPRGISSAEMQEMMKRRRQMEISSPGLFSRQRVKRK